MTDDAEKVKHLRELREAREDYQARFVNTEPLTTDDVPAVLQTDEHRKAMQRVKDAEQAVRDDG